jgi:hypothetical protein
MKSLLSAAGATMSMGFMGLAIIAGLVIVVALVVGAVVYFTRSK